MTALSNAQKIQMIDHLNSAQWSHDLYLWLIGEFRLQKSTVSRCTNFLIHANRYSQWNELRPQPQILLIQHNWAAAFAGDKHFDSKTSSYRLPTPRCAFEFVISGRQVITFSNEEWKGNWFGTDPSVSGFVISLPPPAPYGWYDPYSELTLGDLFLRRFGSDAVKAAEAGRDRLYSLLKLNVKAACIALEAEVAETEIVRVPEKLNAARERRGKAVLHDYHILNLANRKRYALPPPDMRGEKRHSPRLHFRRGHHRHYENYKLWIKWQLVGNPDIGFIDKDYKL